MLWVEARDAYPNLTVLWEREMGKLYGNLMQAALAGFPSPLIGKRQLGAPESRPQTIPRVCLD